ncbi:hypothetical protein M5K25_010705 [Dendrobium thyrsiflorum]|uniref:eRF1 domain-containing protein n=1 Tax=Dendrobium thyrsiflorum TaxID=117978 RepID=A0ABD0V822_DENTH
MQEKKEPTSSRFHKLLKAVKNKKLQKNWRKSIKENIISTSRNFQKEEVLKKPDRGSNRGLPYYYIVKSMNPGQHLAFKEKQMGKSYGSLDQEDYKQRPCRPYYRSIPSKKPTGLSNRYRLKGYEELKEHSLLALRHSLKEVLDAPGVMTLIKDTKAAQEVRALKDFFDMLSDDTARACYGPRHVEVANERMAIQTLLITDSLFK